MKEAGLISARVGPAEVEATIPLSRPLEEVARPGAQADRGKRLVSVAQVAITLGATALAFKASLLSLAAGLPGQPALGALSLVPLLALLLALRIALRGKRLEPDIHDRYLDYILGLALLGGATAAMRLLPGSMSIFFWSWRLDLVLLDRAGGNPLYAEEFVRMLTDRGILERHGASLRIAANGGGIPMPESVHALLSAIATSDGVIMISPEYNRGMSGVLKNALDWASRPYGRSELRGKPVLTITTSPAFTGS